MTSFFREIFILMKVTVLFLSFQTGELKYQYVPNVQLHVHLCERPAMAHYCRQYLLQGGHPFNLPTPITVWWLTHPHAWFNLLAHVRKSVSLPLHVNPSCESKRFPNSITHFILDQSIISCGLQTWLPCTQWNTRLLKAQASKITSWSAGSYYLRLRC